MVIGAGRRVEGRGWGGGRDGCREEGEGGADAERRRGEGRAKEERRESEGRVNGWGRVEDGVGMEMRADCG